MATTRWVSLVALAVALSVASPASASAVLVTGGQLTYTAGPSEANVLDIDVTGAGAATITDAPGIVVGTGGGCTNPEGDNTASCTGVTVGYFVDTGDLGDSVDTSGVALLPVVSEIHGGSGNDGLLGGPCNEDIKGEEGDDVLVGQEGSDFYYGGPGTDAGRYTDISPFRVAPVTATLDTAPNDGSAGESDNVNADGLVENLSGGSEDDTFTGNNGPNSLSGQDGTDTLNGVGGDDLLSGGRGPDNLSGGPDNDTMIENAANGDDTYDGGAGSDRVSYASH